jgi:hypothetical protein
LVAHSNRRGFIHVAPVACLLLCRHALRHGRHGLGSDHGIDARLHPGAGPRPSQPAGLGVALDHGFYALAGPRAPRRLGWINFAICNVGLLIFIPELARLLAGDASAEPVMIVGIAIWLVGMLTFLAAVLSLWTRPKAAA